MCFVQASAALAAAVVTSAFYQRANFYSAMVYLSQSNLCLMVSSQPVRDRRILHVEAAARDHP